MELNISSILEKLQSDTASLAIDFMGSVGLDFDEYQKQQHILREMAEKLILKAIRDDG